MSLPELWPSLLPDDFSWLHLPRERIADCNNCPKVENGEYRADCRCCTYFPQIPNFQLGLALKDPRTRPHIEAVVRNGHVLPSGMRMSPALYYRSLEFYREERFGRSAEILCPFMDGEGGGCRIHAYRNSVCATFFCEYDHGSAGLAYWRRVQSLLGQIELVLSQWAMGKAGMDPSAYAARLNGWSDRVPELSDPSTESWSEKVLRDLWGPHYDGRVTFLEACADAVIAHRERLYEIACDESLRSTFPFEKAVETAVPPSVQSEVERLPEERPESVPVSDLWYKLQLATRRLWELPFNDGTLVLNPAARITPHGGELPSTGEKAKRFRLTLADDARFFPRILSEDEAETLLLFNTPRVVGEALLEHPLVQRVERPRDLLAELLRCGVLVHRDGED